MTGSPPPRPVPAGPRPQPAASRLANLLVAEPRWSSQFYLQALLWVAAATGVSMVIFPADDLANVAMVHLLAVVVVAAKLGRGPSVVATAVGVTSFVYFFVPHYYSFVLSDLRYLTTFLVMLVVGLFVASLTSQLRAETVATHRREMRSQALYELSRGLAAAEKREDVASLVGDLVQQVFGSRSRLFECGPEGLVPCPPGAGTTGLGAAATTTVLRALQERIPLGHGDLLFLPMVVANRNVGLLCCEGLGAEHRTTDAGLQLLTAIANNAAIALHRLVVADEAAVVHQRAEQERLRNTMLSSMSHDFRTPLASITGAVTTLLDAAERIDDPTRLELLQSIREDAEFLERQVRNMLDLTRLESGTLQIHRELHPLDEVVGGAMTRVEALLEDRRVDVDVPTHLPLVPVDALLVEQLLVNLLENAARYAPSSSPVEVVARLVGTRVRIEVADRGPGIPSGQHERIFEKFHRGGAERRSGGAGLGLAIGKAIAQLHGGRIWAEDREGGGARFCVELPLPSEAGS